MSYKQKVDINIRENMFSEMKEKKIFNQVKEYAFDYAAKALERNVYPTKEALNGLKIFEEDMPEFPNEPIKILKLLHEFGSPATVSQIGGRYYGMVNGGIIPAALAAKWLSDFWDQNSVLYVTSPITSKVEAVVEKWLIKIFDLPENSVAGFVSGTSMAILCGLAAARFRIYERLNWDFNSKGFIDAPKIRIVTSKHAHSTVLKMVALLGFGKDNIELVDTDLQGRIISSKIPNLDDKTILILQAGNVNSGSFDDFNEICEKAKKANAWVHIDGAFGLWVAGSEKLKYLTNGMEKANSWSVDGHKTLNTPYDSGIILCNDSEALVSALQNVGSYIILGKDRDGMLYTPEMSRRARAVELWASLKYLGRKGLDDLVYGLHERAVQFADELSANNFEILNDIVFNQVLVSCGTDELTKETLEQVQEMSECWCGGAQWFDRSIIRISVCSWATTPEDITRSVKSFVKAREMAKKNNLTITNNYL